MGRIIPLGFFLAGLFFLFKGLAILVLLLVLFIISPVLLYRFQKARKKEYTKVMSERAQFERNLNDYYERVHFGNNLPRVSGSLDENGIPYL